MKTGFILWEYVKVLKKCNQFICVCVYALFKKNTFITE